MKDLSMLLISSSRAVAQISSCWIYCTRLNVQYVGREINSNKFMLQGSKQVPSGSAEQVDFLPNMYLLRLTYPIRVKTTDPLIESLTEKSKRWP